MSVSQSTTEVEYRDVPGWPGYRVGKDGSVWTCKQWLRTTQRLGTSERSIRHYKKNPLIPEVSWKRLKPDAYMSRRKGYEIFMLYRGEPRSKENRKVGGHVLVLTAFVGPPPQGHEACHRDGNPSNNHLSNLRWDSHVNNLADRKAHGTLYMGEESPSSKLHNQDVMEIRALASMNVRATTIAKVFEIPVSLVYQVISRKTWKHL